VVSGPVLITEVLNIYTAEEDSMFELMDAHSSTAVIKVIGVGGGGGNAVAHMVDTGIEGVGAI
jgi:cell division GTPase FtsZ